MGAWTPDDGTGRAGTDGLALRARVHGPLLRVELTRPDRGNTLDDGLIGELQDVLDLAEQAPQVRVVVIEATGDTFCAGMDLAGAGGATDRSREQAVAGGERFTALMRRLTRVPRLVVARVDGRVAGGGVGLVAACDLVVASPRSTFSLPEALWGLMPCCVAPYLIRRVGFQRAYTMALTTQPVGAPEALACRLADEVADDPEAVLRRLVYRMGKIDPATVGELKRYYARLNPVPPEHERIAVEELADLMVSPAVRRRLEGFATDQRFPWEAGRP